MSTLLQQVLTQRPQANPSNWSAASLGGLQDIHGHQVFYTWIYSQSIDLWPLAQKIDAFGSMQKSFDGDPRFITDEQVEQGGYQIQPGQGPLIIYKDGKTKQHLDGLNLRRHQMPDADYRQEKSQIVEATIYNGSQIASGPGFVPYVNDFKIHPTQQQREQIALLQKMASDNGIEIRHWGTRRFYDPENDVIVLPTRDHFPSPEAYMRTLAHEMVHATMHRNHPQNPHDPPRIPGLPSHARTGDRIYAAEEWRADAGSLRILEAIGVNVPHDEVRRSAAYLQSWTQYGEPDPHRPGQFITGNLTTAERQQAVERSLDAANYLLRSIDKHIDQTPQQTQELRRISQTHPQPATGHINPLHHANTPAEAFMAQATQAPASPSALAVFDQHPTLQDLSRRVAQALPHLSDEHNARITAGLALEATRMRLNVAGTGEVQVADIKGRQAVRIDDPGINNPFTNFAVVDSARALEKPVEQSLAQMQQMELAQSQTQQHSQQAAAMRV